MKAFSTLKTLQTFKLFLTLIPFLTLFSCKDIVEPNISSQSVTINAPTDGYQSPGATITFWWDETEGALSYRLQVVKPNFTSIQTLILDTSVTSDKFTYTFLPGAYEWRIKAVNGSSETAYTTYSLSIDSTLNLSNQIINLVSPANNAISNSLTQLFQWQTIDNAEDYRFEVLSSSNSILYSDANYMYDTITLVFSGDGDYKWRVRGQNSSSVSAYTEYNMTIDATAPNIPALISPADNDSSLTVAFGETKTAYVLTWDRGTETGTTITDSVYVYANSASTIPVVKESTTNETYSDSLPVGTYYWKVMSVDAALNKSDFSTVFKFKVK